MAADDATEIQIADAVVARVNAASLSQPFTATHEFEPELELAADFAAVDVLVVNVDETITVADRKQNRHDYRILVAVRQKVDDSAKATIEPLVLLCHEIHDELGVSTKRQISLADGRSATWIGAEAQTLYEHLSELGQFTWTYTATYRIHE